MTTTVSPGGNVSPAKIVAAFTEKTKAIVPVHLYGQCADMDPILEIAKKRKLTVIEDAAQGVMSTYNGKFLGTLSDFGCYSFHETKNYTCGEGGALLMNSRKHLERAEIIWENFILSSNL